MAPPTNYILCGLLSAMVKIPLLNFTPFTFYFLAFYFLSLFSLFSISDFYVFWVVIELAMLFFIGFCYRTFTLGFSSLMLYFLIQTVASFSLFVFYLFDCSSLFVFSLFLKLSMFPFSSWFLSVVYRFTNVSLFLSSRFHKIPPFLILSFFLPSDSLSLLFLSSIFTLFFSGAVILSSVDFRLLLLASSVGNNS